MKRIAFNLLLLFCSVLTLAQGRSVVSGFVRDAETDEPLIGATVWAKSLKQGTIADQFGHYTLYGAGLEHDSIVVSFMGYRTSVQFVEMKPSVRLDFHLVEGISLETVEVIGQKRIEQRVEMGVLSMPLKEIKTLPSIGGADVLKIMQLMPGIQGGMEGRSGLLVRGGSADQNLMLLDGASVYYVNHYGDFLSLFHPEIISNMKLYKGAFPAKYGGRLSSVVDLRMREGNKKEHKGSFGIGLLSADLLLEGPLKKDTTSYLISARRFYLDALTRPLSYFMSQGMIVGYQFYDVYGKISHAFNENNRFYLSGYVGDDSFSVRYKPWDDKTFTGKTKTTWGNVLLTGRLNSKIGRRMIADFTTGYTRYRYLRGNDFDVDSTTYRNGMHSSIHDYFAKAELSYKFNSAYEIQFGGGTTYRLFEPGTTSTYLAEPDTVLMDVKTGSPSLNGLESYAYLENVLEPFEFLKLNIGGRLVSYRVDGELFTKIEPRLLVVLGNTRTGSLKASYAETMQAIHLLSYQNVGTATDLWMPATAQTPPGLAKQWSLGYSKSLGTNYELSVEGYQKNMTNLIGFKEGVSYTSGLGDWQEKIEADGQGKVYGVEFLLRKLTGTTTGWIGYTYSKSERQFDGLNYGKWFPYLYDRRNDFSLVANHRFNDKYTLSASWVFGTGYPTTLETGFYQSFGVTTVSQPGGPFELTPDYVVYSSKNGFRMQYSHRLDLGFHINGYTKRGREKTWSFNLYNAYNQKNPAYYEYGWADRADRSKGKTLWQTSGLPIVPSFTYRVRW